jgi:hypothetical protein
VLEFSLASSHALEKVDLTMLLNRHNDKAVAARVVTFLVFVEVFWQTEVRCDLWIQTYFAALGSADLQGRQECALGLKTAPHFTAFYFSRIRDAGGKKQGSRK